MISEAVLHYTNVKHEHGASIQTISEFGTWSHLSIIISILHKQFWHIIRGTRSHSAIVTAQSPIRIRTVLQITFP